MKEDALVQTTAPAAEAAELPLEGTLETETKKTEEIFPERNTQEVLDFVASRVPPAFLDVFQKEQLLDWDLLCALTVQDLRAMGLPMGPALKLIMALKSMFRASCSPKAKFPNNLQLKESPVPTTVSELHLLVNAMVQMSLSKAKPTALPVRSTSSESLKTMSRPSAPKKYSEIKSVVSSFRKPNADAGVK